MSRQPSRLADALVTSGLLVPAQAGVLSELRRLRNAAAHAVDLRIMVATARGFVGVAAALLRSTRENPPSS